MKYSNNMTGSVIINQCLDTVFCIAQKFDRGKL